MLCALIYRDLIFAQAQLRRALCTFFVLLLVILVVRMVFTKFISCPRVAACEPFGGIEVAAFS